MIINYPHPKPRPHGDAGLAKGSLEVHRGCYDNCDHTNHAMTTSNMCQGYINHTDLGLKRTPLTRQLWDNFCHQFNKTHKRLHFTTAYRKRAANYRVIIVFHRNTPRQGCDTSSVYCILFQPTPTWPWYIQLIVESWLYSITTYHNMAATYGVFTVFYHSILQHGRVTQSTLHDNIPQHGRDNRVVSCIPSKFTTIWPQHIESLLHHNVLQHGQDISGI